MFKIKRPVPNLKCPNCGYTTTSEVLKRSENHTRYQCTICGTINDVWD